MGVPAALPQAMELLPLERLGVHEHSDGRVSFGVLLPGLKPVTNTGPGPKFRVSVKLLHANDQFLRDVLPRSFPLIHEDLLSYGDFWSTTLHIEQDSSPSSRGSSSWGKPGRYVYRYCVQPPTGPAIDWISDPFAREFGIGALSAFTLGYRPYEWSNSEAHWKTPSLRDLVIYELMITEFAGNLRGATERLAYIADLGINCIELMPITNSGVTVDWGFLPIGYFGVAARFGSRQDMQSFVDEAHRLGIAVIFDSVFGHTGALFPFYYLYKRLEQRGANIVNPVMGTTAKSLFGEPTDWGRSFTGSFFFSVSHFWLDRFHIDGFRYDCVPEYLDSEGRGFKALVQSTWEDARGRRTGHWERFHADDGSFNLITCAEHLDDPRGVLDGTYANCVWQDETLRAAERATADAQCDMTELGHAMALLNFAADGLHGDVDVPKAALQYIENHDHARFICKFGVQEQGNELFNEGDRPGNWERLQPYLIALLTAKGIPLLWQGQEICESYWLPKEGVGRPHFLRPIRWELMYDDAGQTLLRLVRQLLQIRRDRTELRRGAHFVYDNVADYKQRRVLIYRRGEGQELTVVALNFGMRDVTVPFTFPCSGLWIDRLAGVACRFTTEERPISITANFGRVWTLLHDPA